MASRRSIDSPHANNKCDTIVLLSRKGQIDGVAAIASNSRLVMHMVIMKLVSTHTHTYTNRYNWSLTRCVAFRQSLQHVLRVCFLRFHAHSFYEITTPLASSLIHLNWATRNRPLHPYSDQNDCTQNNRITCENLKLGLALVPQRTHLLCKRN